MNTKTKFSKFNNIIFFEFCILAISFIWINFYIRNFTKSLIISGIVLVIFSLIFFPIKLKKDKKLKSTQLETKQREFFKLQLLYGKTEYTNVFILNLLNINNYNKIDNYHYYDKDLKQDIFFIFNNTTFREEEIYNKSLSNNILIISLEAYKVKTLLTNYIINYCDYEQIFSLCNSKNLFPNTNLEIIKNKKYSLKEIFTIMLNSTVSKKYFIISLILIFYSVFSRFKIYYMVFATITIILSIYSRFNKRFNKKSS